MGTIQHIYTQTVADGTATSVVRPSDWNSAHAYTLQDAVSLGGNTAGVLANISSGTLILAGGNNITVSQNGNSVTISGPNVAGAQTGISGIIASDATYTSGSVYFSGNNITIASSVNGASQYVQFSGNAAQTNQSAIKGFGVSNTGQTAGNTGISTGIDWVMAGSNLLTLSQSTAGGGPNTVWIQHPAWLTTADLSANSSKYVQNWKLTGNTAGTTSSAQGTDLWFSGGNSLTVSGNSNTIVFSVGNYLTTGRASTDAVGLNTAKTNVTWTVNSSGISLNAAGYAGTGTSATNASITLDTNGLAISVAAQSNQSAIKGLGVSNTGQTAGNTGLSTGIDWVLAGSQSITLSQSTTAGGPNTIWFQHPAWLTTADLSANSSKYAGTGFTSAGANIGISGTQNTAGLSLSVTVAAQSNQSAIKGLGVSNTGNTSGNTGLSTGIDWVLAGSQGLTMSQSTTAGGPNTIWGSVNTYSTVGTATTAYDVASVNSKGTVTRWAAEDHSHAGIGAVGISTAGNTAGTTKSVQGTYWFQGGQSITLSQITSNNGSHTLVVSGPQDGYCGWLEPLPLTNTALFGPGAGSWYLAPFDAPGSMSGGRINFLMQNTGTAQLFRDFTEASVVSSSTGAQQQGYTYSLAAAIFSAGTGSNSTRLESKWSNSFSFGWTKSVSVSSSNVSQFKVTVAHTLSYINDIGSDGAYTMSSYVNSSNSQVANSSTASNFADSIMSSGRNMVSGSLVYPIGFNTTFSAGAYWLGFAWSTTRSNASTGTRIASALDFSQSSIVGISRLELETLYRNFGSTVTTARSHLMPYGLYTAAANMAPPQFIALSSDLSSLASAWVPYFNFQVAGLTK